MNKIYKIIIIILVIFSSIASYYWYGWKKTSQVWYDQYHLSIDSQVKTWASIRETGLDGILTYVRKESEQATSTLLVFQKNCSPTYMGLYPSSNNGQTRYKVTCKK